MKHDPQLTHYHPSRVYREISDFIKERGAGALLHSAGEANKKLKEKFSVICLVLGWRKHFGVEWFIKDLVGDPPDFELVTLTERKIRDKPFDHVLGELVTIPNIKDSDDYLSYAYETVTKKLDTKKAYVKETILLVFINSKHGPELSPKLSLFLSQQSKYPMIWSLYFLSVNKKDGFNYNIDQLYPKYEPVNVSMKTELMRDIALDEELIKPYLPK